MSAAQNSEDAVTQLKNLVLKERRAVGFPNLRTKVIYTQSVYALVSKALAQPGVTIVSLSAETGLSSAFLSKYKYWDKKSLLSFREMNVIRDCNNTSSEFSSKEVEEENISEKFELEQNQFGKVEFVLPFGFRLILRQLNKQKEFSFSFLTGGKND